MIHYTVTVDNAAELLNANAYGAGALLRWESSATFGGVYVEGATQALVSGTSLYDVWDTAGVDGVTWYQTRISNAAGSTFSAYSAPFLPSVAWASLSVAQLRGFVTSSLPDDALQTLLAAAAAAVSEVAGPTGAVTEYLTGHYTRIVTARLIGTVTSVTEDGVLLTATGYRASGYVITRLDTSADVSTWGSDVVVVYTPADATAERQRVQLELVKLDLNYQPGVTSEQIGTWTETLSAAGSMTYAEQRADILASLTSSGGGMLVVGD